MTPAITIISDFARQISQVTRTWIWRKPSRWCLLTPASSNSCILCSQKRLEQLFGSQRESLITDPSGRQFSLPLCSGNLQVVDAAVCDG